MKITKDILRNITVSCCAMGLMTIVPMSVNAQEEVDTSTSVAEHKAYTGDWEKFEINDSLLHSFSHSAPNVLVHPELLNDIFEKICQGKRPLRVLHIGDSHIAGKVLPTTIKAGLCEAFGTAADAYRGGGIYFTYLAKNGATALNFLIPERIDAIKESNADLIIMSFGTNECHGMGYDEGVHRRQLDKALGTIRELCPKAVIIMTTPPGDYLAQRSKYYVKNRRTGKKIAKYSSSKKPNPMVKRCAALISSYADDNGMLVWDLNTMAGGDLSVRNWISKGMMSSDRVHFTPKGYTFQGNLFVEAFKDAFNRFLDENR